MVTDSRFEQMPEIPPDLDRRYSGQKSSDAHDPDACDDTDSAFEPDVVSKPIASVENRGAPTVPPDKICHPTLGEPSETYPYYRKDGTIWMIVYRWEADHPRNKTGKKEFAVRHFDGKKWVWKKPTGEALLFNLPELAARPNDPVMVHEGEKAVLAAKELFPDYVHTTWPSGRGAVRKADLGPLSARRCVLVPDADTDSGGILAMQDLARRLEEIGANVKIAEPLSQLCEGADVADIKTEDDLAYAETHISNARDPRTEQLDALGLTSADMLVAKEFSPQKWLVEPYLTEGLMILAGKPKMGKSWWVLELAIAVASGTAAFGHIPVDRGDVLCISLEDTNRRLKRRLLSLLGNRSAPSGLDLVTQWRALENGGIDDLKVWLSAHPQARLVIIDTFVKVRKRRKSKSDIYDEDYDSVRELKALADKNGICILLVHHLRKSASDDPIEEVSGSTGLTGAVDGILVLKRDRAKADAVLFATGRDIEEAEAAFNFDFATCKWSVLGDANEYRRSEERNEIIRTIREAGTPLKPLEIAEILGKEPGPVRYLLMKMKQDSLVNPLRDGRYEVIV